MIGADRYRVVRRDDDIWWLYDRDRPAGQFDLAEGGHWTFLDPAGGEQAVAQAGEILHGIPTSWPAPVKFGALADEIYDETGAKLAPYLPWAPALIAEVYAGKCEQQARLAGLFAALLARYDEAGLSPTRLRLQKLAYHALAQVYEAEDATSGRLALLAEGLKRALSAWYTALADDNLAWCFGPADPQAGREAEMWALLADEVDGRRRLRRLFRETPEGRAAARRVAERWFLPRYDLHAAEQVKRALRDLTPDGREGGYLDGPVGFLAGLSRLSERALLLALLICAVAWLIGGYGGGDVQTAGPIPLLGLLYLALGAGPALSWLLGDTPDTSTPRLLAGILVALVGVIMQQNWAGLALFADTHPLWAAGIGFAIAVAALRVLLGKVRRALGAEWPPADGARRGPLGRARAWARDLAVRRTAALWGRGLAAAFLLSLVVSDLLGDFYLGPEIGPRLIRFPGAVGHIYPGLALFFTALLLFAGVFVQLLWEEKPLTEGIA